MGIVREHTKVIDEVTYTTRTFPASEGLVIYPKLLALFGEEGIAFFLEMASGGIGGEDVAEQIFDEAPKVAKMVASIATNGGAGGFLIIKSLFTNTKADKLVLGDTVAPGSVDQHFDEHFSANYAHLAKVAFWVAKVNFGKLFAADS